MAGTTSTSTVTDMWEPTVSTNGYGLYILYVKRPGRSRKNATFFRDVPVQINSLSYGDPFGDATAELTFPQITPYDDPYAIWFLQEWTDVDVWWVPATEVQMSAADTQVINPSNNRKELWLNYSEGESIWEGFTVSYELTENGANLQCQGALYQVDKYLAKPQYPDRPMANERLIRKEFNPKRQPLRTKPLDINWPEGWELVFEGGKKTPYKPRGVAKGEKWTGYATRNTGSWDRALTGYTQELLSQMYTSEDSGVDPGNQWTISLQHQNPSENIQGRQPILEIRDVNRPVDFELWYGTPGVSVTLTHDAMSTINVIYGMGTGFDGTSWSNMDISTKSGLTSFLPIAYDDRLYPYDESASKKRHKFPSETMVKFSDGIALDEGINAAKSLLMRERDPGFNGSINVKVDPGTMPRHMIRAGMTVRLRGYAGFRDGIRLHIAEVTNNPDEGTVDMRVDTSYRDLLTLEEVQARVRDPLTPAKMLRVGMRSGMIEDTLAPWDFSAGSGCIPSTNREFFIAKDEEVSYPWLEWVEKNPPKSHDNYYIEVDASNDDPNERWVEVPILMSQAGSARLVQIICVDKNGNLLPAPFHVSFYKVQNASLPRTDGNSSPFLPNHFQNMQANGAAFPEGSNFTPSPHIIVGWGNADQKCGYTPNRSSDGADPTGMFMDESVWSWDMADGSNLVFSPYDDKRGRKANKKPQARTIFMKVYVEAPKTAYIMGRIFRLVPGT